MRLFRLCERSSEWGVAQTTQLLRSRTLSPSFTRNRRDLFQHGGNCPPTGPEGSNLVPPLARKFSAFSKIQVVCKSSQVIMHGKLNIKPKSENVDAVEEKFENCNRILSGGNNVKEEKRRGRKTSAAICGKIEPVVTGESTRLSEGIAATRENVPRASSTYNKKKMFEIYQQSLLFQASRRIVRGKMKEMQVDTDTSVKSLKRKLFAMNMRDHTEDKKLVSEEDIERTATILQAQEKSNPKLLPFDMSLLRKAVRCLNDEMLGSAERKALFFCAKNVDSIERCFENAKIGTQICIMSNKLPLALPIITTAFRKRLFYIERIRKVDLSFDCSSLKSEKYQQIFCLFFKHAGLADPRVSYVDWALELLSRDHLTPSLEFLVSSLTLLGKCNDKCGKGKELLKQIMSHGKIGWSDIEGFSMGELQSFASNILPRLAKLYEVELEVDKIFPRFESAAQEQLFKRYSMIASQDICVPMSSDKIPPQYKLTDILTYDQLIHNYHRQLKYENLVNVPVTSIEAVDCDVQSAKTTNGKKGRSLKGKERSSQQNLREIDDVLKDWHRKMTDEIVEALHLQKRGNFFDKDLYEVLQVIDLNALVDHLIEIALTIGANEIAMPHFEISNQIEQFLFNSFYQQYLMRTRYMEKLDIIYPKFAKLFFEEDESLQVSARDKWISLQNEYSELGPGIHDFPSQWSAKSCSQLCRLLITILLKHCQVPTNVAEKFSLRGFENDQNVHSRNSRWRSLPCLSFRYITQNSSYTGARSATIAARTHLTVYPHLFFTLMARETNRSKIKMLATCIPTLVPPVPWCSQNHGGYLVSPCQFMRIGMSSEAWTLVKEALLKKVVVNDPDMDAIYDSVYTFSSVPWRINRQVFDVVSHLFKSGGDLQLDIPLDQKNMRLHLEKNHPSSPKKGNELQIFKRAKELKQAETDNYGLRMSLLYQLSIADRLKNEKAFWFPSNMDFRGRCYDIPPVFNHIGDDKTRALLMFAQGKPLGETGFMWLKLQFASLSGNCKRMGYSDRLQYVDSHMDLILDSAAKPLSGFRWWTTLDEPFQCLACCFEISNAVKSGDIAKYVSHLPIHQDGSCNGLQHYAALGRDSEGNGHSLELCSIFHAMFYSTFSIFAVFSSHFLMKDETRNFSQTNGSKHF